jgi:hypothetical protein
MGDVTDFLWVLAAIGGVLLAIGLAVFLSRLSGAGEAGRGRGAVVVEETGSRYARDNDRSLNPAAFLAVFVIVGGLVALILVLSGP